MLGPTIESAAELEQRDSKFKIDTIIISFNINFRYESWILRIKDKIIVPRTQSIKFIDKSSWIKLRQIRELIGLLTLTKQLTNWSNNERNNTIQLSRTSQKFIFLGHFVKLREFTKLIHEVNSRSFTKCRRLVFTCEFAREKKFPELMYFSAWFHIWNHWSELNPYTYFS